MHFPLLDEIMILFALSSVVLLLCHRLRLPTLIAFLLTGALAGPQGFGLVQAVKEVELLAELGIVLLMFTIGLELSLTRLFQARKAIFLGGGLQVGLSVGVTALLAFALGVNWQLSVFEGFLVSLSSTAIVLKLLQDRGSVDTAVGRAVLGILIFQDMVAIPMMLLIPELAGTGQGAEMHPLRVVGYLVAIAGLTVAAARWLIPFLLDQVAKTQNREVFLVAILAVCFSIAWLTSWMGLSLALGAFLAGLIVAESEYSHTAVGYVLPFKDVFSSFFFVSVGMLLDAQLLWAEAPLLLGLTLALLGVKTTLATGAALAVGLPLGEGLVVGMSLAQVGEFSFVLARGGASVGLLEGQTYERFLAVSVCTMLLTPGLLAVAPSLAHASQRWPLPQWLRGRNQVTLESDPVLLQAHLVVIGYGFNGMNVARACAACALPYVILETQPELVRSARAEGQPILYGDASQDEVLRHAQVGKARVVVVAISDPAATRQVTSAVRRVSPHVHLIVRTRYMRELEPLHALGASEVIPEEYETSVEIFSRVLDEFLVPREEIERQVAQLRQDGYGMFRSLSLPRAGGRASLRDVPDIDMGTVTVDGGSRAAGQMLGELSLRREYGVTLLVIQRAGQNILNPGAEARLLEGDRLTLVGTAEQLNAAERLFSGMQQPRAEP